MKKLLLVSFSLWLICLNSFAQITLHTNPPALAGMNEQRLSRIDTLFEDYLKRQWIAGGTVIVARHGQIVYHKAFGYSNLDTKTPATTQDIYRIASQTKALTSVGIMILLEEGKLLLDDPLAKYIPEFANPTVIETFNDKDTTYTTTKARRPITIRDLLTHTSGIGYAQIGTPRAKAMYAKAGIHSQIGVPTAQLKQQVLALAQMPLEHQPGERFTYGLNSDVLGYLIEVISGQSFAQFIRTRITEPLGMQDTWFYLPPDKHKRLVALHTEDDKGRSVVMKTSPATVGNLNINYPLAKDGLYSGGAGLVSTAYDYAIFMQMLLNGGIYNNKRIISKNSVDLMTQNQIGNIDRGPNEKFGLGFGILTEQGSAKLGVSPGSFSWGGAFSSQYWIDPKEGIVGQIFLNQFPNSHGDIHDKVKVLVYSAIEPE